MNSTLQNVLALKGDHFPRSQGPAYLLS